MKKRIVITNLLVFFIVFMGCKTTEKAAEVVVYRDSTLMEASDQRTIHFKKGKSYNHPTFVIWEEEMNGTYLRTLFITQSYATGKFGYRMVGDSIWLDQPGDSHQPAALPYWTHKKGPIVGNQLVPTQEHPFVDAYTGATPSHDFQFQTGLSSSEGPIRIVLEVNQAWDWNRYWVNNKYPDSPAYKHSAQPSIIYAEVINPMDSVFYLNPIGHGDPKGESGKLFTDLSTLTTAKEIFESIIIKIRR
jgi:hypothetical protein